MDIDYTSSFAIKSSAGPIVFITLYAILFIYFFIKTIARPVYVYFLITIFCAVRITTFALRLLLAKSDAGNLAVVIAYDVLYNTFFFGLLWSADALVTARIELAKMAPRGPVSSLLYFPIFFYIASFAAIGLSIAGAIKSGLGTTQSTLNTGNALRKIAIYIFLGCSILLLLRTWFLVPVKLSEFGPLGSSRYGLCVLLIISILLLIREVFFTITANSISKQNDEAFWYPFSVVTEFLVVVLSATPALVPDAY